MEQRSLTFRSLSALCAVNLILLGSSIGVAHAEQISVADVARTATTADGWQITLSMTEARVNAVPSMSAAPLSSEGYLSARVTLTVDGEGASPVNSGELVVGAQLGCQVDLSEGLDLGVDFDTDLFDDVPVIGVGPDVGSTLHSGGITTVGLGAKTLKGRVATIFILDAHVQVDQCAGAVTVRLFASASMSTDTSDDSLNAYGEVLPL